MMNFLRENLFFVSLIGGTVVLCLILVGWGYGISGQIDDEEIGLREQLSSRIETLSRPPYENIHTIHEENARVAGIKQSLAEVQQKNIEWNSRNFTVPRLRMLDGTERPALPYDKEVWERNQFASFYVQTYHKQLDAILASLHPTQPPGQHEIEEEAARQEKVLERQEMIRRKNLGGEAETADDLAGGMQDVGKRETGKKRSFSQEAVPLAESILQLRKARSGLLYANMDSFKVAFARGVPLATLEPEEIWNAQVALWVQSDIAAVLAKTIRDAQDQQHLAKGERSVITSPIKRLIEIRVGQSEETRRESKPQTAAPFMPGAMGPMGPMGMPTRRRSSKKREEEPRTSSLTRAETLTENTANRIFDVQDYSFTVLMSTRYLPLLEENLMQQNYHVILNEEILAPETLKSSSKRDGAGESGLYYYGVEPVRKVTIRAQLLLMAGWTRGTWDADEKKWIREPLMPVDVIQTLPAGAKRPEDKNLVDHRLPMPWSPSAARKAPAAEEDARRGRRPYRRRR